MGRGLDDVLAAVGLDLVVLGVIAVIVGHYIVRFTPDSVPDVVGGGVSIPLVAAAVPAEVGVLVGLAGLALLVGTPVYLWLARS